MIHQPADISQADDNVLTRVRHFNASLDSLMRLYTNDSVKIADFLQRVTEECCNLLHCQRVSIWRLEQEAEAICCSDLYLALSDEHFSGAQLMACDFPQYFNAMLNSRVIDATDARIDPRTSEFAEVYLAPNNIISMLDAQIRSAAGPRGVVCIETVNIQRIWSPDEIAYAVSIAELVGFALDREERQRVLAEIKTVNTELQSAKQKAELINERYNLAIDAALEGVWDWDVLSNRVYFSKQNFTLLGFPVVENDLDINCDLYWWKSKIHTADLPQVNHAVEQHLLHNVHYDVTYRIQDINGIWHWWRSRGQVIRDKDNLPKRFVGTNSDVTKLITIQTELERRNEELVATKKAIETAAMQDRLTGLPNRRYMESALKNVVEKSNALKGNIAFLHIDLDYFKEVNDTLGHAAGDFVLEHVAQILKRCLKEHQVGRIGGDEFVAVIVDTDNTQPWETLASKIIEALNVPIYYDNTPCKVGASIGIAVLEDCDCSADKLLVNADIALYQAKDSGRNCYAIYTPQMRLAAETKRQLHHDIRDGLEAGQFVAYFQPQFCASDLSLSGVEALVRWHHPTRGTLYPDDFLDAVEELDCVGELDKIVLEYAVKTVSGWQGSGLSVPKLSVNVSSARLSDPMLIASISSVNLDNAELCFELLESIFLDDTDQQVASNIHALNELGIPLEIDDFGTGYASIASLINIKPKRLKIDRGLIMNIDQDPKMMELVSSLINIANTLSIEVVAEGVETQKQISMLKEIGCHYLQGYALGKPIDGDAFFRRFS